MENLTKKIEKELKKIKIRSMKERKKIFIIGQIARESDINYEQGGILLGLMEDLYKTNLEKNIRKNNQREMYLLEEFFIKTPYLKKEEYPNYFKINFTQEGKEIIEEYLESKKN